MTEIPTKTPPQPPADAYAQPWSGAERAQLPRVGGEREVLTAFLDWHRATFEAKCSGIPPERLSEKGIAPSGLSLHGLLRHLSGVERWWFRMQFAGEELPHLYYTDDDPDQDFEALDGDVEEAFAVWRAECERSREIVAKAPPPGRHRPGAAERRAGLAARDPGEADRGVRPAQRPRRSAPRADRRRHRLLISGLS